MDDNDFIPATALKAAIALDHILRTRKHRKVHLGEVVWVRGKLGDALKLPKIIQLLNSKVKLRREQGLQDFKALWPTLSLTTRRQVEEAIGWYDAKDLDWDDKRSNRRARLDDAEP
ncbi:MAG: hypothetical protein P8104_02085 [Gammaproteobacteria bacterium]